MVVPTHLRQDHRFRIAQRTIERYRGDLALDLTGLDFPEIENTVYQAEQVLRAPLDSAKRL
jgi:hypothetical protein